MALNMASIHTTTTVSIHIPHAACAPSTMCKQPVDSGSSQTITTAIYALAAEPEKYLPALRAEVLEHCVGGKIDKQTLGKLSKLDSFLRECGRVEPAGICE